MASTDNTFQLLHRGTHSSPRAFTLYLLFAGLFCLIAFPNVTTAATYYLDAVNGDDSNPGTSEAPWQTIPKIGNTRGGNTFNEGDTCYIRNGSYSGFLEESNTDRTSWTKWIADTGHTPTVEYIVVKSVYPDGPHNKYYWFEGLTIFGGYTHDELILFRGNYGKLKGLTVTGDGYSEGDSSVGIEVGEGCGNVTIENCIINGVSETAESGSERGIYLRTNYDISITGCDISRSRFGINIANASNKGGSQRITIGNNVLHDLDSDGIFISDLSDSDITDNQIYNIDKPVHWTLSGSYSYTDSTKTITRVSGDTFPAGASGDRIRITSIGSGVVPVLDETKPAIFYKLDWPTASGVPDGDTLVLGSALGSDYNDITKIEVAVNYHCDGIQIDDGNHDEMLNNNIRIDRNKIYNIIDQGLFINMDIGANCGSIYFRNNLLYNIATDISIEDVTALYFINNTVAGDHQDTWQNDTRGVVLFQSNTTCVELYNNIIDQIGGITSNNIIAHNNNIFYDEGFQNISYTLGDSDTALSTLTQIKDLFIDYDNNDYTLAFDSTAIDFGNPDHAPATDILGVSRSIPPDAGCYEYISQSNNAPVLQAIGNKSVSESSALTFTVSATDADGDTITYSASDLPSGASFDADTQNFSWTPSYDQAGTYDVTFIASDGQSQDSEIITILVNDVNSPIDPNEGLVGYWKFDDGNGTSAVDSSGNSNAGTLINSPAWTTGKVSGALSFDGVDDAVEIPTANWNVSNGTVALWAYAKDFSGSRYLFGHTIGSWSNRIQLYLTEGSLCLGLGDSHTLKTGIQLLTLQTWYHITLTWDGTNYIVYVDGIEKARGSYTGLTALNAFADIGNTGNTSYRNEVFNGVIDDVRVYNRALTSDEVLNLFNDGGDLVFDPIGDKEVDEGSELTFEVLTTEPNIVVDINDHNLPSDPLFFSNIFSWTPTSSDVGSYEVTFEAPYGEFIDFETITITVNPESDPPTPDPMTWATQPYATGSNSISMTATTASDSSGVQYYFECTAGGGNDSGWQDSPIYEDTGLTSGTQYTYRVKARDKSSNQNETGWSSSLSATTQQSEPTETTYEAEDAVLSGPQVTSVINGYTGTGFADYMNPSGDYIEWTVTVGTSGQYELQFRYALGSGDRPLQIKVNGQVVESSLSFPATGNWSSWGTVGTTATLSSGQNTVRATAIGSSGGNVDHLKVIISVADTASPSPDPMTWATQPYATGISSISMTATTASDASGVQYYFECITGGGNDSGWQSSSTYEDTGLSTETQYTYRVKARDKSSNQNETSFSSSASATTNPATVDSTAPSPDPMTWATQPYATGSSSISMTATTATDDSGVEYYFECTAGGGNDSGWQDSSTYEDTRLSPETQYTYRVKARDKSSNQNETSFSSSASATTNPAAVDSTAPGPDPMTWATQPYAAGSSSISMTATTASDASGVQYYFECTAGGGNDSGWQDSPIYEDTGLTSGTQYTYRVKARDKSSNQNETDWSSSLSATTQQSESTETTYEAEDAVLSGLQVTSIINGYTGTGFADYMNPSGDYIEWTVTVGTSGQYELQFRYALGSGDRPLQIKVNGQVVESSLSFPATGNWSSWGTVSTTATLSSGQNTVRATAIGSSGGNVDHLKVIISVADTASPSPDPMTWATQPYATGSSSISMTATTATDDSGVEYYFECITGGGNDSSWQSSSTYEDTGLSTETQYTYRVKARDKSSNQNETSLSSSASATTNPAAVDSTAPSPDPMTWATQPYAAGSSSISMTATTASDASGVQYYFECTAGGGNDSGWQDSPIYEDTGLTSGTQYTYRVKARDKSSNQNETGWSSSLSATTQQSEPTETTYEAEDAVLSGPQVTSIINGYTGTGFADYMNPSGDYIEWTVTVGTSGQYELQFRYALGSGDRPLQIKVNGQVVESSLSFPATGNWSSWGTVDTTATLSSGQNTVRATAIGSSGGNVDHLKVVSQ